MTITMEEAEKIAEEFFHGKKYEDFEVISCARGFYSGWELTNHGQISKSGKPRVDELKVEIDDTGKVLSYNIKPGIEASSGKRKRD